MEITLERGADRRAGTGIGRGFGLESGEVLGHLAVEGLGDHPGGARPDAGQVTDPPLRRELAQLVDRTVADGVGRLAERLLLVPTRPLPFEQGGDALQRVDRIHPSKVPVAASSPNLIAAHGVRSPA